ncbi:hypothetical protein D3C85_1251650 [compost metagenome]
MQAVDRILQSCSAEMLNLKEIEQIFNQYICTMSKEIPAFVDDNERNHLLSGFSPFITILWLLYKRGHLRKPAEDEMKRICTVVWEG